MHELTPQQRLVHRITACQRGLYSYILTLVASPTDAEDILQETNLVLVRKAEEWDGADDFRAWACAVAYRQVLAYFKRRARDRHAYLPEDVLGDLAARASERLDALDARLTAMRACLSDLPEHTRSLIAMRYDDQQPIDRIAESTRRSSGAVRVALHRARLALLDCIRDRLASETL